MSDKRPHSVPVPQLYKEASKILRQLENKEGSLKTLVYGGKYKDYKKIFALLCKATQNDSAIKHALSESRLFIEEPNFNPYLAQVLATQLLAKGSLAGDCKPIQVLRKYEEKIRSLAAPYFAGDLQKTEKGTHCPRYVRVNTLVASLESVLDQLAQEGWELIDYDHNEVTYDEFLEQVQYLGEFSFLLDYHIPDLLVFPPNTQFWNSVLYRKNAVILQDKASCIPVFVSGITPGASVLDACAAPGNKTSYIAAAMDNTGDVLAVEKDTKRFKTLTRLLRQRGATCVSTMNKDFSKLSERNVQHIFLDPTCSSSGVDFHSDRVSFERVQSLASFQAHLLLHALSFSSVEEVVYSTCSVNVEENEEVVQKALAHYQDAFELENIGSKLPGWKHFGDQNYEFGSYCLRTDVQNDMCQGFFVAKFIRKGGSSCNNAVTAKKSKKRRHTFQQQETAPEDSEHCDLDPDTLDGGSGKRRKERK